MSGIQQDPVVIPDNSEYDPAVMRSTNIIVGKTPQPLAHNHHPLLRHHKSRPPLHTSDMTESLPLVTRTMPMNIYLSHLVSQTSNRGALHPQTHPNRSSKDPLPHPQPCRSSSLERRLMSWPVPLFPADPRLPSLTSPAAPPPSLLTTALQTSPWNLVCGSPAALPW